VLLLFSLLPDSTVTFKPAAVLRHAGYVNILLIWQAFYSYGDKYFLYFRPCHLLTFSIASVQEAGLQSW
jgi:hypothetical protein